MRAACRNRISQLVLALVALTSLLLWAAQAQAQAPKILYAFRGGADGSNPTSRLTFDAAGNLYGTTEGGGLGFGTVFQLSPNGSGGWTESVIHSFTGADGSEPLYSPVIFDNAGNLYGETKMGGVKNQGVVFRLTPGAGGWTETVLHSFLGGKKEGCYPVGALAMDVAGNIFGTNHGCGGGTGGTVFELSPAGGGTYTHRIIYGVTASFGGVIMDGSGNLFGTTRTTGLTQVFGLSPNGSGGWNANILHTFTGAPSDGGDPEGTLALDNSGNLYGTTRNGGSSNRGTVYKLTHGGGGWSEAVIYPFPSGKNVLYKPFGGVIVDAAGNVYGTTTRSGGEGGGVFELQLSGGSYVEKDLATAGTTQFTPEASMIFDGAGNLYGTFLFGTGAGKGGVFEVTP